ncbi:hypothetical protein key_089 [Erwinia phage KEY]|uniref:Uncharacterized protein n=1 Tax=Erwinia phage KEY TaxID=2821255 RepID=A0AAE8BCH9_9CAUD|nr:hypothetical protein key_089 [Erwinia phage KEY]
MSFPRKVYIVMENGPEWAIRRGVFKHRPDAVLRQKKILESNESFIMQDLKLSSIDIEEEIVL